MMRHYLICLKWYNQHVILQLANKTRGKNCYFRVKGCKKIVYCSSLSAVTFNKFRYESVYDYNQFLNYRSKYL